MYSALDAHSQHTQTTHTRKQSQQQQYSRINQQRHQSKRKCRCLTHHCNHSLFTRPPWPQQRAVPEPLCQTQGFPWELHTPHDWNWPHPAEQSVLTLNAGIGISPQQPITTQASTLVRGNQSPGSHCATGASSPSLSSSQLGAVCSDSSSAAAMESSPLFLVARVWPREAECAAVCDCGGRGEGCIGIGTYYKQ